MLNSQAWTATKTHQQYNRMITVTSVNSQSAVANLNKPISNLIISLIKYLENNKTLKAERKN